MPTTPSQSDSRPGPEWREVIDMPLEAGGPSIVAGNRGSEPGRHAAERSGNIGASLFSLRRRRHPQLGHKEQSARPLQLLEPLPICNN